MMPDREKVIKGLERCKEGGSCDGCQYFTRQSSKCIFLLHADALALLKEQEKENSRIANEYLNLVKVASKQPKVVRCKDCKHRHSLTGTCVNIDGACFQSYVCDDWFCADGEHKSADEILMEEMDADPLG